MKNEYKRRQLLMKMAGYNVPLDGSWGPYQLLIWDKMNTKEKEYKPTIWGLLLKGYDTITGNTTYKKPEATVTDLGGRPGHTKSKARELRDIENYWHPILGAGQRWKASMSNDTNPLVGISRTIVPAVAGAAAIEYTPAILTLAAKAVPHMIRTAVAHPHLSAQVAKTAAINTGKTLVKGTIGGETLNGLSKLYTDKSWGQNVAPYLGTSEEVAEWFNPGYLLGGKSWGITKRLKNIKAAKLSYQAAQAAEKSASDITLEKKALHDKLTSEKPAYSEAEREAYDKHLEAMAKLRDVEEVYKMLSPLLNSYKKRFHKRNSNFRRAAMSEEAPLEGSFINYKIQDFPLTNMDNGVKTSKIKFKAPNIESESEIRYTNPTGFTLDDVISMAYKPEGIKAGTVRGRNSGRFGTIIEGDTKGLLEGIGLYVDDLHNVMGEDGTVAGSLVHYRNGVLKGTQRGDEFIGPADTEIYTTTARYPELAKKLQFKENATNSTGGHKGTSPYTFRNTDSMHNGLDTEINIIEADENGMARGKIAHQIYRSLYPEKYSKISYDHTMSGNVTPTSEISLPVTAEELLLTVRKDPEAMQTHLLTDLVGMETFTNPQHTKATKRLYSILFDSNPETAKRLNNALQIHGKYNMGSQFKLGTELYPNILFNDVEANKQFLRLVYQLSEEEANQLATNPDVMKNAFNLYNFSMSTNTRMVGNDVITDMVGGQLWHDPRIEMFTGNGAFSGGTASGAGLNTTLLNPFGGWHPGKSRGGKPMNIVGIAQRPLTYKPETILTPMDLVNLVGKLSKVDLTPYYARELATFNTEGPITYNAEEMARLRTLSEADDAPVLLGLNQYGFGYSGGVAKPIAAGARTVSERDAPELGSLLRDIKQSTDVSTNMLKESTPRSVLKYITDVEHGGQRYVELFKLNWKKASPAERGKFIRNGMHFRKGNYFIQLADNYFPMRRGPLHYNYNSVTVNGVQYNPSNMILTMSRLNREYDLILRNGYTPDAKYMANYKSSMAALNKLWRDYMKYYKAARKNLYNANLQVLMTGRAYTKALLASMRYSEKMREAFKDYLNAYKQYTAARSNSETLKWNIKHAKRALKEHLTMFGVLGGGGYSLFMGLPYILKNQERKYNREASKEQAGKSNPKNGYYEMVLTEEADELNDSTINEIDKKVKEAQKKYEENVNKHKKGGKTHKPFGHRSILDNGWQSTKLLKNKKNVYGK